MTTGTEKERLTVSGICKLVYAIWQRDIWILPCERTGELETHPRTRKKDTINLLFSLIEEDKNLEYVEAIESNRATPVFHGTVDIPERIRRKAESCSTELIKSNFKNRIYRYLDENQRKYFGMASKNLWKTRTLRMISCALETSKESSMKARARMKRYFACLQPAQSFLR